MEKTCNLGWHYYRNYFHGIDLSNDNNRLSSDATEKEFKKRNNELVNVAFPLKELAKGNVLIPLETIYPGLVTGLGYSHEVSAKGEMKLGFFFDYTTGLPVIPGSSVKGVLRSAFPQWIYKKGEFLAPKNGEPESIKITKTCWIESLLSGKPIEEIDYKEVRENIHNIEVAIFEGIKDKNEKKPERKFYSIYERDIFFEAFISKAGKDNKILGTDSITPHIKGTDTPYHEAMLQNPVPIPFMKILPGVQFTFQFDLKKSGGLEAADKKNLFEKILLTIGIGAKTNVGYGQFRDSKIGGGDKNKEGNTGVEKTKPELKPLNTTFTLKNDQVVSEFVKADLMNPKMKSFRIISDVPDKGKILTISYFSEIAGGARVILNITNRNKDKSIQNCTVGKVLKDGETIE